MQTAPRKLLSLQLLRGLAAFSIAFGHVDNYAGAGNPTKGFAWLGIDLFFVISGFVIAYTVFPHAAQGGYYKRFAVKRLARIYPTYWIFYLLALVVMVATGYKAELPVQNMLLALPLFPQRIAEQFIPVAWSLHFELWFYLVTGLLLAALGRRFWIGVVIWSACVIAVQPFMSYVPTPRYDWAKLCLSLFQLEFALGFLAGWLVWKGHIRAPGWAVLVGCVLALATLAWGEVALLPPQKIGDYLYFVPRCVLLGVGFSLLVYGMAGLEAQGRLKVIPRFGVRLGDASYSLYLGHDLFYVGFGAIWMAVGLPDLQSPFYGHMVFGPLALAGAVMLSIFFSERVERPLWRIARQFGTRRHVAPQAG